jgi:pimeloyl-ACP methyl ester carboxylesterase
MSSPLKSDWVGGIDLLVRDGDPTRTIVFLHGIGGRASSFAEAMQRWPEGPRLIAWDMPGYGGSKPLKVKWATPRHYATKLCGLIEDLNVQSCDLVGQSLGGLIAGYAAAVMPEFRVHRRLVLVSPALGYKAPQTYPLPPALAQRLDDFEREGADAFAARRAARLVFDAANRPGPTQQVRAAMATLTREGHRAAVQALAVGNLMTMAASIRGSALLLSGSDDVVTPLAGTKGLLDALAKRPRATDVTERLVEIPRAGHAAYLEDPDAFVDSITSFLAEAP